jgi:serine/threonine-protein kinase
MTPTTAENLLELVGDLDLVASGPLAEVYSECGGHDLSAQEFGQALVRRELLTRFQLERLLRGERKGYIFGDAKLLYQVGSGTFARVYRAVHRSTNAVLAVKVLRNRFANDALRCRSFQKEGETGKRLRHPNIVGIEDVGQEDDTNYLTMEFIEGQTVRELVRARGAMNLGRALVLIHHMASGLEYVHSRGVTHRDFKASNVLVAATGVAKLVDFGLASTDDGAGEKTRTVDYATLEKASGVKDDNVRSDIYFLGTVAYLALAGVAPIKSTRDRLVRADPRRFKEVIPLATQCPEIPKEVADIVHRMMHLDPMERWQTVTDLKRPLEGLMARWPANSTVTASTGASVRRSSDHPAPAVPLDQGRVMLVESGEEAQGALREFFRKLGFRALLTENAARALSRFTAIPLPADFIVFSSRNLEMAAVEAFNRLSTDSYLAEVPAILLVAPDQEEIVAAAKVDARRQVVQMPAPADAIRRVVREILARPE